MLLHLLLNQGNSFGWNVTPEIIKAWELSQQWKKSITYSTAQFGKVADFLLFFVKFSEPSDFDHLSFEIGSVSEKVTFVELVEFVPNFLSICFCFLILFLRKLSLIFFKFLQHLLFHLFGQFIENDFLFWSSCLI